jgi:O-acetyl-ADP-ribose deacetylase (regulator of RNase III)
MKIDNAEIKIQKGDITDMVCDAIVNAANNHFYMGGGVAAAIKNKGGIEIEQDAVDQGPVPVGGAVTTSGYRLKAKFVIHAAVMSMPASSSGGDFQTDAEKIRKSTFTSLSEADKNNCLSIAFPALGCGVGGFPYKKSAKTILEAIKNYLANNKSKLKEIIFVLYNQEAFKSFKEFIK